MVIFDRKSLIESQNDRFNHIYNDINFFVWLAFALTTIVAVMITYFFTIAVGLWMEAIFTFCSAMYYLIMSFTKEKMALGYYQQAVEISAVCTVNGLVLTEITKSQEKIDYMIAYDNIYKVVEYNKYFIIMLKNEGRITLPNLSGAADIKNTLKDKLGNIYHIIER